MPIKWNKSLNTRPFFFLKLCFFLMEFCTGVCVCDTTTTPQNKEAESQKTRHHTYCKTPAIIMIKKSAVTSRQEDIFWASFSIFFCCCSGDKSMWTCERKAPRGEQLRMIHIHALDTWSKYSMRARVSVWVKGGEPLCVHAQFHQVRNEPDTRHLVAWVTHSLTLYHILLTV